MNRDANELLDLVRKRGAAKAAMTRISTFMKDIKANTLVDDIITRIECLDKHFARFMELDDLICSQPQQLSEIADVEPKYCSIKSTLRRLVNDRTPKTIDISAQLNDTFSKFHEEQRSFFHNLNSTTRSLETVKLPKLNIPSFGGNYSEFPSFKYLFESSIHNNDTISNVVKFQYLKGLVRDEALDLLKHITVTEANYTGAWEKLVNRYDKKRHVINEFIQKFIEQPNVSANNTNSLRRLYNTSDEVIRGLKALGTEAESRDHWLIYLLLLKVDKDTRQHWAKQNSNDNQPTVQSFLEFVNQRCDMFESTNIFIPANPVNHRTIQPKSSTYNISVSERSNTSNKRYTCKQCQADHQLHRCEIYLALPVEQRRAFVTDNRMCYNCLYIGHPVTSCPSERRCYHCNRKHHSTLHDFQPSVNRVPSNITITDISTPASASDETTSLTTTSSKFISILPTALVKICDRHGNYQTFRMLLDSGSQTSLITEDCVRRLQLQRRNSRILVTGVASSTVSKGCTTISMKPHFDSDMHLNIDVLILDRVPSPKLSLPTKFNIDKNFKTIQLADPDFGVSSKIDIILGSKHFFQVIQDGRISSTSGSPTAINTSFGWVIAGDAQDINPNYKPISLYTNLDIDQTLRRFWEIEEEHVSSDQTTGFKSTYTRNSEGRFVVKLPFKSEDTTLGDSYNQAKRRLLSTEKKLLIDKNLALEYYTFMQEYEDLGHMEEIPSNKINNDNTFFLPHHAVVKLDKVKTKIRVVFDGSAKSSNGKSLNDILLVGPTIQPELATTLLRFRTHNIAMTGDIEKMYRQILVTPEDTSYQQILWRRNPALPIKKYRLNTVTYGTSSAPFLAIRSLQQIGEENKLNHPDIASIIKNDFYVDDILTGASTLENAKDIKSKLIEILNTAGFNLTKWRSNKPELNDVQEKRCTELSVDFDDVGNTLKVLGIQWNPNSDTFSFKVNVNQNLIPTKRNILSEAAKIFDPHGWLAPAVVKIKILFQKLWILGADWDDKLPLQIIKIWSSIISQLHLLEQVKIQENCHCIT